MNTNHKMASCQAVGPEILTAVSTLPLNEFVERSTNNGKAMLGASKDISDSDFFPLYLNFLYAIFPIICLEAINFTIYDYSINFSKS